MASAQLNALLSAGSSSIVFDARANDPRATAGQTREPFFNHGLLKSAILLKIGEGQAGLRTRLFLPFDGSRATRGGVSMACEPNMSCETLETYFGMQLDRAKIDDDVKKIQILAKTPSFAPFLLRDAFERSGLNVDVRYFQVSDSEVAELKDSLKAKLKPLAAMALPTSGSDVENAKLNVLVNKLWELDDAAFLAPFAHALKIPNGEATEVLYAWIGVSYFNREFAKRQTALRAFAEWLVSKPPFAAGVREEIITQFDSDRKPVRDRVRAAWTGAGGIFDRFNSSYDRLIQSSDATLFVDYLKQARPDFLALGAHLAFIEQALCIYDAIMREKRGSERSFDLLRDLASSMRGVPDNRSSGQAAA